MATKKQIIGLADKLFSIGNTTAMKKSKRDKENFYGKYTNVPDWARAGWEAVAKHVLENYKPIKR